MAKKKNKNRKAMAQRRAKAAQKRKQKREKAKKRAIGIQERRLDAMADSLEAKFDNIDKNIMEILGKSDPDEMVISTENLSIYHKYLTKNLSFPCLLTGMEDFPWEERFVFGYGDKKEYEELKQTNPSYTDTFVLMESGNIILEPDQILVEVERQSDKKRFVLPLEDLETEDEESPNQQIIESYSSWYVNYQ